MAQALAQTASTEGPAPFSRIERTWLAVIPKETGTTEADDWNVYKTPSTAVWLGEVEAPNKEAAIQEARNYGCPSHEDLASSGWVRYPSSTS